MKEILLQALACPKCHQSLMHDAEKNRLICHSDKLIYPIKEGIPILLINEATPITD